MTIAKGHHFDTDFDTAFPLGIVTVEDKASGSATSAESAAKVA